MLKILLRGCNGRMGRAVSELCAGREDITVAAGVDFDTAKRYDYPVYADALEYGGRADAVVDFSWPERLEEVLDYCIRKNLPLVLATTGLDQTQRELVRITAQRIPVFQTGNLSLGISLLKKLVSSAAAVLGEDFDVEIIERHHNQKLDAPSGTANMLYEAAAAALPYEPEAVYDRHGELQKRGKREIGMHAVRGGAIVGDHEVIFAGHGEVITLSHSALSREVFAAGAIRAARFIAGKPAGMYGIEDMI